MRYREAARKLVILGCHELPRKGTGSHRKWFNPRNQQLTILPDWGAKDLRTGTVRAAVRQLGIDWREFEKA
jgi:predicted RNA binding protein YcfA (HicA-like mRNA interferase family)